MTKKYKKNTLGLCCYFGIRGLFILSAIIGLFGLYEDSYLLMKIGLTINITIGTFMGILHIICFRLPKKYSEKLFKKFVKIN